MTGEPEIFETTPMRHFRHQCTMEKCIHYLPPGPHACTYPGVIRIGGKSANCLCYEPDHEKHKEELRTQMEARYPGYRERLKEEEEKNWKT